MDGEWREKCFVKRAYNKCLCNNDKDRVLPSTFTSEQIGVVLLAGYFHSLVYFFRFWFKAQMDFLRLTYYQRMEHRREKQDEATYEKLNLFLLRFLVLSKLSFYSKEKNNIEPCCASSWFSRLKKDVQFLILLKENRKLSCPVFVGI